jgi:hypothetical protein
MQNSEHVTNELFSAYTFDKCHTSSTLLRGCFDTVAYVLTFLNKTNTIFNSSTVKENCLCVCILSYAKSTASSNLNLKTRKV